MINILLISLQCSLESLPRKGLLDEGEMFPPPQQPETFLDEYLKSHQDTQLPQRAEFEKSPWEEILRAGVQPGKEWPPVDLRTELRKFEKSFKTVDSRGLLSSRVADPDGYLLRKEQERIKQTETIARSIVEDVLEMFSLHLMVESLLAEIIEEALTTVPENQILESLSSPEEVGVVGHVLKVASQTSQEDMFPSQLSQEDMFKSQLSQEDMFKSQLSQEDMFNSQLAQEDLFSSQLSQEDMFNSQLSQEDMFTSSQISPAEGERFKKNSSPVVRMTERGDGGADVVQKVGPLVPYTPSPGESSNSSELEEDGRVSPKSPGNPFDAVKCLPEENFTLLPIELQEESIQFCVKARQMNVKVQRLSASNDSFQTVSSGDPSQESVMTSDGDRDQKDSISPIQILVEECSKAEQMVRRSEETPVQDKKTEVVPPPRRICQRYEFLPDHTEDFVADRVIEDLGYRPVTSFVMKENKTSSSNSAIKAKKKQLKYILIQNWLIENEEFVVQLEKSKELLLSCVPDEPRMAHILVGPVTGIYLVSPTDLSRDSLNQIFSSCSQSLTELWLLSIGSYEVYMQCVAFAYEKAGQKKSSSCKVFALLVNEEIESVAQWVIQLASKQSYEKVVPHLREATSRHETMLRIFPCLNTLSAKIILSKVSFLDFLRLSSSELSSHFPWLSEASLRCIKRVASLRFRSHEILPGVESSTW